MARAASSVVSVRVSAEERALLDSAAEQAHTNLSDFVRRKAVDGAEAELLNRSTVVIPAADWDGFEAWLDEPARRNDTLAALARRKPSWEA